MKFAAKEAVKKYNISMVPGLDEAITDIAEAKKVASEIDSYFDKSLCWWWWKRMRVVENEADLNLK
jgi:propionyl-CoA carboxylase alpha chain